jgi:hypothetical protein
VKWVDNLLSHYQLPGVLHGRQGVQRRVSDDGLLAIELARVLNQEIGVPLPSVAPMVRDALASRASGVASLSLARGVTLVLDLAAIERQLLGGVVVAMESLPRVVRGRPRGTRRP